MAPDRIETSAERDALTAKCKADMEAKRAEWVAAEEEAELALDRVAKRETDLRGAQSDYERACRMLKEAQTGAEQTRKSYRIVRREYAFYTRDTSGSPSDR